MADSAAGPSDNEELDEEAPEIATSMSERMRDMKKRAIEEGKSEIEQLAERIETRREHRIPITMAVRKRLLNTCRQVAEEKEYPSMNKIDIKDLMDLHEQAKTAYESGNVAKGTTKKALEWVGFHDNEKKYIRILEEAVLVVKDIQAEDDDWFYYQDFNFYYTRVVAFWPWMRSPIKLAIFSIIVFYFFTPILFCSIMDDEGVCPSDPTGLGRRYYGWVSALYFASTTMSTVGYGDLSVFGDGEVEKWRVFIGACYMIAAILVAITAFSAAADAAFSPASKLYDKLFSCFQRSGYRKDDLLYQQIQRIKFVRYSEIIFQLAAVNLIGMFAVKIFAKRDDGFHLTWMESFYWAVQTTTTIGYGDLDQPFNMRWFQIFYLIISTYVVGSTLGSLASLKSELDEIRIYYAWSRREVSKGMIEDMQAYEHDDKIDQYEFVVASLLTLEKISSADLEPIMARFKSLDKTGTGVISMEDAEARAESVREEDEELEKVVGKMVEKNVDLKASFIG